MKVLFLLLLLCVPIITLASVTDAFLEAQIEDIDSSRGLEKVKKIIAFLPYHPRSEAKINIQYGQQALELLDSYNEPELKSILNSKLIWPTLYSGKKDHAKNLLSKALYFAQQSNSDVSWARYYQAKAFQLFEDDQFLESIVESNKAYSYAEKTAHPSLIADVLSERGITYSFLGDGASAQTDMLTAMRHYQSLADNNLKKQFLISTLSRSLLAHYRQVNNYVSALKYALLDVDINLNSGNEKALSASYNNIAVIFKDLEDYQSAIEMHHNSLTIKEKHHHVLGMIYSHRNLGEVYRLNKQYDLSLKHLDTALELGSTHNFDKYTTAVYLYKGRLYRDQGKLIEAENFLDKADTAYSKAKAASRIAEVHLAQARLAVLKENYELSKVKLLSALEHATKANKKNVEFASYQLLSDVYNTLNRPAEAYETLKKLLEKENQLYIKQKEQLVDELKNNISVKLKTFQGENLSAADTQRPGVKLSEQQLVLLFFFILVIFTLLITYLFRVKRSLLREKNTKPSNYESPLLHMALSNKNEELWCWQCDNDEVFRIHPHSQIDWNQKKGYYHIHDFKKILHPDDKLTVVEAFDELKIRQLIQTEFICRVKTITDTWLWIKLKAKVNQSKESTQPASINVLITPISEPDVSNWRTQCLEN